jgi:gamma-glutamylcyclotransferase (GGCT)/AIG2-like uncharacterized protein YtfP
MATQRDGPDRLARVLAGPSALFVYGTLLFADVLRALIGRVPDGTPAAAPGWRAAALPGHPYPGLVRAEGAVVAGRLLTGLRPAEWRVIDAFENGGYDLTGLTLTDGRHCWAYTWAHDVAPRPDDWSAEEFAARHLAVYVERLAGRRPDEPSAGGGAASASEPGRDG